MNKISLIIPTKNRTQDVMRCLKSISIQTILPNEIIIVDSSNTDELKSKLNTFTLNIRYIRSEPGLTHQRNIGIKNSSGDIIIFLDDDVIIDKDYIKEIIYVFNHYPPEMIGGVTGEILNKEREKGLIQKFRELISKVFAILFFLLRYGNGRFQLSGFPTIIRSGSISRITNVEFLYGCNMAFRKKIINRFKFDENLLGHGWGEDDDIAYRISRKYQNIYTPFAKLMLNGSSPSTGGNNYNITKKMIEYHYYLFKKNLPRDFTHQFAFWWSVIGLFLQEFIRFIKKPGSNNGRLKGLISGIQKILTN